MAVVANLSGFAAHAAQPANPARGTARRPRPHPSLHDTRRSRHHRRRPSKQLVDSKQIIGVSALVYERDKEVYFGAFGLADRENNKPMTRDTVVQIFSMTKPITGVALMQLYERGKFGLDDPLELHAPEFANLKVYAGMDPASQPILEEPKRKVTMRDILRHTAGLCLERWRPDSGGCHLPRGGSAQHQQYAAGVRGEARARCRWPINPARAGSTATRSMSRPTWCRRFPACRSTTTCACTSSSRSA